FFSAALASKVSIGNFEDDLARIADADWIIEVVAENLEIKRGLLAKVAQFRKPGSIVTTNTSGLPVHLIAEGLPEEFQQHWAGTHFFNPPRYMKLVEVIPGPKTSPEVVAALSDFCDRRLGKGVDCQRHAELHRQPHRDVFDAECPAADAGAGHDYRRGGCVHGARGGLAEVCNVPHRGFSWSGCADARSEKYL